MGFSIISVSFKCCDRWSDNLLCGLRIVDNVGRPWKSKVDWLIRGGGQFCCLGFLLVGDYCLKICVCERGAMAPKMLEWWIKRVESFHFFGWNWISFCSGYWFLLWDLESLVLAMALRIEWWLDSPKEWSFISKPLFDMHSLLKVHNLFLLSCFILGVKNLCKIWA